MNVYFLNYNSYYNRKLRVANTLPQYFSYVQFSVEDTNFNPNDGINTEFFTKVINDEYEPNYVIVCQDNEIISRWFIMEYQRIRSCQYLATLRRDVMADYWNVIKEATAFVEKGDLDDNNPLIFNQENMTLNQIKSQEYLLKDKSAKPWLVGYMTNSDVFDPEGEPGAGTDINIGYNGPDVSQAIDINTTLEKWKYYASKDFFPVRIGIDGFAIRVMDGNTYRSNYAYNNFETTNLYLVQSGYNEGELDYWNKKPTSEKMMGTVSYGLHTTPTFVANLDGFRDGLAWGFQQNYWASGSAGRYETNKSVLKTLYDGMTSSGSGSYIFDYDIKTDTEQEILDGYNGKVIHTSDNKYYKVKVLKGYHKGEDQQVNKSSHKTYLDIVGWGLYEANMYYIDKDVKKGKNYASIVYYNDVVEPVQWNLAGDDVVVKGYYDYWRVEFEEQGGSAEYTVNIKNSVNSLIDAPYRMFAIPYEEKNRGLATSIVSEMSRVWSGAKVLYDVQILPYFPLQNKIMANGNIDTSDMTNNIDFSLIKKGGTEVFRMYWMKESSFSFTIPIPANKFPVINKKLDAQCNMYRLVSPNYASMYEFNVAKNGGLTEVEVDCTYKPYSPYIHLNPRWGGIYQLDGSVDFNDARGLICGGDFSVTQINDAWETYQIQNKNFMNSFNREIQSIELNNKYAHIQDIVNNSVGAAQGIASGAMAGSIVAPGVGTAVGAAVGAVGGLVGGHLNTAINQELREDALNLKKDLFGYQLGNIQALPTTIATVGVFNKNFKFFPFIEEYKCTETERKALEDKITYNGKTIMVIGKINDYILDEETYVKAKLIRLEGVNGDFHLVNEIANELDKGVYV